MFCVENFIIVCFCDWLVIVKNVNEMFCVFFKFNVFFVCFKICGVIVEYQIQFIDNVKQVIIVLYEWFKQQYGYLEVYVMVQFYDFFFVFGVIIWVWQIEWQFDIYMKKVEDVFGVDWVMYVEG